MSGEMTVRTTSKAKALMKALNVSVSVLPLLSAQEDNSRRVVLSPVTLYSTSLYHTHALSM